MKIAAIFILIGIALLPLVISCVLLIRSFIRKSSEDINSIYQPSVKSEKFRRTKWYYLLLSLCYVLILAATFCILYALKDNFNLSIVIIILAFTHFLTLIAGLVIWQVTKIRKILKKYPRPDEDSSYETLSDWQNKFSNAYYDEYAKYIWRDIAIAVTIVLFSLALLILIIYLLQL